MLQIPSMVEVLIFDAEGVWWRGMEGQGGNATDWF